MAAGEMIDRRLDLRGKVCPSPTLDTAMALREMTAGQVLEVVMDFYPARQTVPDLIESYGYEYEFVNDDEEVFRVVVCKS